MKHAYGFSLSSILTQCILMISLSLLSTLHSKVLIFTFAYNRPDFIELQHKLFEKFLQDEYSFVVFDDSKNTEITHQITNVCAQNNIGYFKVPQEAHDRPYFDRVTWPWWLSEYNAPSVRNCNVVQYALDVLGFAHDDLLILLESDVFLVKPFSFKQYMLNVDLAGYDRSIEYSAQQQHIDFMWIGLIYINMATLPNKKALSVNCGKVHDTVVDSGGYLHYYLSNHTQTKIKFFDKVRIENFVCHECTQTKSYTCNHNTQELTAQGFDASTVQFIQNVPIDWGSALDRPGYSLDRRNIEFLNDNHFVHFFGASGYANIAGHVDIVKFYQDKTNAFTQYIRTLLTNN